MSDTKNPKRLKTILSFFGKNAESLRDESTNSNPSSIPIAPVSNDHNQFVHPYPHNEIDESDRVVNDQEFDINSLEHDSGIIVEILMNYRRLLEGIIQRERFFGIVNVADTKTRTLKDEDCPYAYYVHYFAHRLQLALIGAAEEVRVVYRFFSMLIKIVNFVGGSTKRSTELKLTREAEIEELLDAGLVETGKGANQVRCLQRPGTTRWGSHFKSVNSLIELFSLTKLVVENLKDNRHTRQICGEAEGIYLSMTSFEFVFVLHFLNKVLGITNFLCQKFQKKSADIVSALNHISITKMLLQKFRDNGWENFLETMISFYETHEINMPDMSAPQRVGTGRSCQQNDDITIEHHYHFDIFNVVIDKQMNELDDRFPKQSKELLTFTAALDPQDDFRSFKKNDICSLVEKFYPQDFTSAELYALDLQLIFYAEDIHSRPELQNITSLLEL
ncbi:PREDICTED: uncharacterized protein LOC101309632 [Fragaria vesca subsp. vesca]